MSDEEIEVSPEDQIADLDVGLAHIKMDVNIRSMAEVLEEIAPQGSKVKLDEIAGQPVIVISVRFVQGEKKPFAFVQFTDENGELFNVNVGGMIVMPKLKATIPYLPLRCTFIKKAGGRYGRYWDIE